MSKNYILSFLTLLLTTLSLTSQNIVGDDSVCIYECKTYTIENASGGLFIWNVSGGRLNVNTGTSVTICWKEEGDQSIKVLDLSNGSSNPVLKLDVKVVGQFYPEIYFPEVPSCAGQDSIISSPNQEFEPLECNTACENSTATYTAIGLENSQYEWTYGLAADTTKEEGRIININWGDVGFAYLQLTETSEAGCEEFVQYCIEILERPAATIINNTNIVNPCVGQTVYLNADSPEAVSFIWEVNNTIVSTEQALEYEIESNVVQNISLITTSECLCKDTTYYSITPITDPGPQITCVGTTCVDQEQSYYAEDICGIYNWTISSQGTITEGGNSTDNFITVVWNDGPIGEISLSAQNCQTLVCSNTTIMQVPIIEPTLEIEGPDVTCKKGLSVFIAPKLAGTNYSWSIAGNGSIIDGANTHQITVRWEEVEWADNTSTITLNYENCLLECGGTASKTVTLKPEFILSSFDENVCVGQQVGVEALSGYNYVDGDWIVTDNLGNIIATETNKSGVRFDMPATPGMVEITMTNTSGDYCNTTSSGFLNAVDLPDMQTSFEGPLTICLNEVLVYEAAIDIQNDIELIWTFIDGGTETLIQGNKVSYSWTSTGPYSIELVSKNIINGCESDALVTLLNEAQSTFIEGETNVCVDELSSFSLTGVDGSDVEWVITPESAGNFRNSLGLDTEITFYESGKHELTAKYCGVEISIEVDVFDLPSFTITAPDGVCENETGAVSIITDSNNTVEVSDESFNLVSTSSTFDVGPGNYTIKVISPIGCEKIEVLNIGSYILPSIRISSPDETGKCNFPFDVNLVGINTLDGYTFKWFKDGLEMGETGVKTVVGDYGIYHLEVANINGCLATSNSIKVYEECRFPKEPCDGRCEGMMPCESLDSINFEFASLGFCNTYSFTNASTPNVDLNNLYYDFQNEESGTNNRLYAPNGNHTFTHAGYYVVMLRGLVESLVNPGTLCDDYQTHVIEVPVAARFETQEGCSNTEIEFLDKSTLVGNNIIADYEWDFGDPSSGANNTSTDKNPKHTYSRGGTYIITMTISAGTGCKSRIVQEIRVLQSPEFELNLPFEQCIAQAIKFEAVDTGNLVNFKWEFDDPTSGNGNEVNAASTLHKFQSPGIYAVSLTCQNNLGCETTVVKNFEVGLNSLSGDITIDKVLPVCEGDSVTLTAPNGGAGYIWSNGDVGQSIKVADPDSYIVTVINTAACDYVPDAVTITVIPKPNINIYALYSPDGNFNSTAYFNTLEICQGEQATLRAQYFNGVTYEWSTGSTQSWNANAQISSLPPGEHSFTLDVTNTAGCTFTSDPFIVKVNPRPTTFTITSDQSVMCEGDIFNFTIDSPSSDYTYYWNTGQVGTSISAQVPGNYWAIAINNFGCERNSNVLTIHETPNMSYFQTGCYETCFPDEICFPSPSSLSLISWLKDGQVIASSNSDVLTVTEAGEYQVIVESFAGCIDTSEILTLEAMPSDQSVSGIVYLDENDDEVFNTGDVLLDNITINLMTGSTILTSVNTNSLGEYTIDPVNNLNTYVEIDTIGTGLKLTDLQIRYDLVFDLCVEDKIQDFPVTKTCEPITKNADFIVCQGEMIDFNGQFYIAGDTDSVTIPTVNGCDTIFQITVSEAPVPIVNSVTLPSCSNDNNGQVEIQTTQTNLSYSVDGVNFSSDLNYDNLAFGNYDLFVQDDNGCTHTFPFTIQEVLEPVVSFNTTPSCEGFSSGIIDIITSESNLTYSTDGINFTSDLLISDLSANDYSISVMNDNGCTYDYAVEITEVLEPSITFDIQASCSNTSNGLLEITFADPGSTFSLNGTDYTSDLMYSDLSSGNLSLFVSNAQQCVYEYPIVIPENLEPTINALSNNACIGINNGAIELLSTANNIQYSLDGVNFDVQNVFNNLGAGLQTYYVQDELGCVYQDEVLIESFDAPDLSLSTTLSCNQDGTLEVNSVDGNIYSYSLTNGGFSNTNQFTNITPGSYTLYVMNANNCVHEESFTIEAVVEPLLQFDLSSSCTSIDNGAITAISNNPLVQYAINGSTFSNNNIFENLAPSSYVLSVQDEHGCIFEHDVTVEEIPQLNVTFDDPIIDCSVLSVDLTPSILEGDNLTYEWSNGSTDSSIDATSTGTYSVQITNGCETQEYEWDLEFENINEQEIYVPNVFSPDNDGNDDDFKAFKSSDLNVLEYDMAIFDKWGNKMFEDKDFDKAWDGRFNQENVQSGVYVWMYKLKATYCNQEVTMSDQGSITVLR